MTVFSRSRLTTVALTMGALAIAARIPAVRRAVLAS